MTPTDILTLLVATYGAVLSTILAINEVKKNRRTIKTFIEYMSENHSARIRIVNSGYRPVTITSIRFRKVVSENGVYNLMLSDIPEDEIFKKPDALPQTITDGQQIILELGEKPIQALSMLIDPPFSSFFLKDMDVLVYDADENVHTWQKFRIHYKGKYRSPLWLWMVKPVFSKQQDKS